MRTLTQSQKILLVIAILILGGVIGWFVWQRPEPFPEEDVLEQEGVREEVFSLSGVVSEVNVENNFLIVKPVGKDEVVKVIVTKDTKLFRLEPKLKEKNPAQEYTLERVQIGLGDIKEGDNIFIKTKVDIAGKKEFNGVDYIEILP